MNSFFGKSIFSRKASKRKISKLNSVRIDKLLGQKMTENDPLKMKIFLPVGKA